MAKIKIECEIDFDEELWYSHNDAEELEWFISVLNDKKEEERIKLVALIVTKICYVSALIMKIQNEAYELKDGLIHSYCPTKYR